MIDDLIKQRISELDGESKPRLRVDRVALRLVRDLQDALNDSVPGGTAVIVTITAPIRQSAKTTAELVGGIRSALLARTSRREFREVIHGNEVCVRIVKSGVRDSPKVIGFVHNPDPQAATILLNLAASLVAPSARA